MFKPGKNRDKFFNSTELMAQVDHAIDIFGLALSLFLFDNAPSHLKCAADAISATKMVKSGFLFIYLLFCLIDVLAVPQDPKHLWKHHLKGPHMYDGINPLTGEQQSFYFPDEHPFYLG
jgi:hypothetical protein